jgi:peptidylprolyl isomerase
MRTLAFVILLIISVLNSNSQQKKGMSKETHVLITTSLGEINILLYNETPQHRDNFIKLAKSGFYDSILFHRVIKNFMIQCGDPDSKGAPRGKNLGSGGPGYNIPAEIIPAYIHKKGAIAAARLGDNANPLRQSSGSQFYIVQGSLIDPMQLKQVEENINNGWKQTIFYQYFLAPENKHLRDKVDSFKKANDNAGLNAFGQQMEKHVDSVYAKMPRFSYTEEQKKIYSTIGGTPHLDQSYTVFGEVTSGMDVVEKINMVSTDPSDRPIDDVKIISMKVIEK